jgi:hypothetical protein
VDWASATVSALRIYLSNLFGLWSATGPTDESANDPLVLELRMATEVKQESDSMLGCFEVVKHLRTMFVGEFRAGLQFDDDLVVTNQVWNIHGLKRMPLIAQQQPTLGNVRNLLKSEFQFHALLINRFQKAVPFLIVDLKRGV